MQNFTLTDGPNVTWGSQATQPEIDIFMDVTTSWMEGLDYVERYFWFGAMYDMVNALAGKSHR